MQKAIKYSKIIAWAGIVCNATLLATVLILYYNYLDRAWVDKVLDMLYPLAFLAGLMMYGGIITKAVLEYKSGVKISKRDVKFILLAVLIAVVCFAAKLLLP